MKPVLKNLFCDRDGTIIYDRHYLADPSGVELLPGAADGLLRLSRLAGGALRLFVVTNQSGIGRGLFTQADYEACQEKMAVCLAGAGVAITDCAFCPHAPGRAPGEPGCYCRKPETGMWEELRARHALKPEESAMIGDKLDDVRFARRAGFAAAILVLSGKGGKSTLELGLPVAPEAFPAGGHLDLGAAVPEKLLADPYSMPDCLAADLCGAADYLSARFGFGHA